MNKHPVLVLAGTGKTGARVARRLAALDVPARTAARHSADVRFDWDDATTHPAALDGVERVYLVPPALRLDFADQVAGFVDTAVAAGVRHVTYLSAWGVQAAPPAVALRAVELGLEARPDLTHTILRPAWFMQNFSESFFAPAILESGAIVAPTGDGAEAFVDAEDIAAVAAATLVEPDRHAGAAYALTGPEALTMAAVADRIGAAAGRPVGHVDVSRASWIDQARSSGVPADYAEVLASLFDVIRGGHGADPTDDVQRVTGRPATRFAEYVERAKAAWASRGEAAAA